jgi:1,4-alpha-glucan branching enzyme
MRIKQSAKRSERAKEPEKRSRAAKKRVEFKFHAPDAHDVSVAGTFNDWSGRRMNKDDQGNWKALMILSPGTYQYRFIVDGEWRDDPTCPDKTSNDHGGENCVVRVQA